MGMKISILYLGKMEFPKFRLVDWKDEGAMVQSPAVAILIQHPTLGNILYDTGNCEDFSAVYTEEMLHDYPITEMISIQDALVDVNSASKKFTLCPFLLANGSIRSSVPTRISTKKP